MPKNFENYDINNTPNLKRGSTRDHDVEIQSDDDFFAIQPGR